MFEDTQQANWNLAHQLIAREKLVIDQEEIEQHMKTATNVTEFERRRHELALKEIELQLQIHDAEIEKIREYIDGHPQQELLLETVEEE